ncbi:ankyrin repeat domain-containing protein [bacterium]|nr:MAG: ankyrin repeat domain-containing protein [bacterium]
MNKKFLGALFCALAFTANVMRAANGEWTPLHQTAKAGNSAQVRILIAGNADIHAQDNDGWTPLHVATILGRTKYAELLLLHNACVNAQDNNGLTPLHHAAFWGHTEIVTLLLQHGANTDNTTNKGKTAEALAQENSQEDVVKILQNWDNLLEIKEPENAADEEAASASSAPSNQE